jgi:hypothetical protein
MRNARRTNLPRGLSQGEAAGERFNRGGMGGVRAPHPPEHNLIQRPDILRDIANFLGLRQPHITPSLAENIQAVLVLDDLSRRKSPSRNLYTFGLVQTQFGDGVSKIPCFGIYNPADSATRVHITKARFQLRSGTSLFFGGSPVQTSLLTLPTFFTAVVPYDRKTCTQQIGSRVPTAIYGSANLGSMAGANALGQGLNLAQFTIDLDVWTEPGQTYLIACSSFAITEGFGYGGMDWEEESTASGLA